MKESTLENSNILIKDPRIIEIDHIVAEVKESEEWEAVQMNILEIGIEQGIERGIREMILDNLEEGIPSERICEKLCRRFELSTEKAQEYFEKYSVEDSESEP